MSVLAAVERAVRIARERRRLARTPRVPLPEADALARPTPEALAQLFAHSPALETEWHEVAAELAALGITERAGGVNPGDRRALYYLFRHWQPADVLEVGTHIGASTVHIAAALRRNAAAGGRGGRVTSVDVVDVNDSATRPWLRHGATRSPRELQERIGMADAVTFVARRSIDYLRETRQRFDVVFLDGDHSAPTVYHEVPAALAVLQPGGAILLHDYFPALRPLWPDGRVIPGPWLAVERLRAEGLPISVLPLGELPWPTKQGIRRTSLALLRAS